jgi:hypothetical protein
MRKYLLIATLFLVSCDQPTTINTAGKPLVKTYERKVDGFIDTFKMANKNMNLNDITCKEANEKFTKQTIEFVKKDGDISDIRLTIQSMNELSKGKYLVHFHTNYSEKVQLDIFAKMDGSLAKRLSQGENDNYYILNYKKVRWLNSTEAIMASHDRVYSYDISICSTGGDYIPIGNYSLDLIKLKHT